ncbi:MAG: glycosyltransferase family A protein [Clostridium sp.]
MNTEKTKHTFAICAYKESPYLEACIRSVKNQTVPTDVICCTSTPCEYIEQLTRRYGVPLFVRDGESGIREDWLFAYQQAKGEFVTIAHQDDRYSKNYVKYLLENDEKYPDMTVFGSDYLTLKGSHQGVFSPEYYNPVWLVKKVLRLPLRFKCLADRTMIKRSALIFGNSICCPSCTYSKAKIGDTMFDSTYEFALDWDNLYELAGKPGRFICVEKPLIEYRIHPGATTKACIEDHRRTKDEISMFEKIWPRPIVKGLMFFYKKAYGAYK